MIPRPPSSTRTDTLVPYSTLFLSLLNCTGSTPQSPLHQLAAYHLKRYATPGVTQVTPPIPPCYKHALMPHWSSYARSEEHTSQLQSLMRLSYAVLCFKKQTYQLHYHLRHQSPTISPSSQ